MAGNSNVILIDPNQANINTEIVNGIPQYQDMYIFAELIAESKGRTVIVTTNGGQNSEGTIKTGLETERTANFMGVNQDNTDNNPNYLNFTTNYYDGSTGNRLNYESFGITNIKIKVNSSYVPQISIQFVDIRGLSFFNQEGSPYRMIFEFPPPTFVLSVKGYYGKTLSYKLHLVKYTSEFMANNGNFVIDAEFIAQTFAPLTDILFRYAVNVPLIEGVSLDPDTKVAPRNTFELILKVKNLYSAVEEKVKSENESRDYDAAKQTIANIDELISIINSYSSNEFLSKVGTPYLMYGHTGSVMHEDGEVPLNPNYFGITNITNLSQYNGTISDLSTPAIPTNISERLFIGFVVQSNIDITSTETTDNTIYGQYEDALTSFKLKLIPTPNTSLNIKADITSNDMTLMKTFYGDKNLQDGAIVNTKYVGIDLTNYYYKLYKLRGDSVSLTKNLASQIGTKVNNIIEEQLGMKPTIYNIFKIILNDVDDFFNRLKNVAIQAETIHNEPDSKRIIQDNSGDTGEKIYAFPLIINRDNSICGGKKEERIAPIELSEKVSFPELTFVTDFVQTFQRQARFQELFNMREEQNADGSNVWIPLSPLDSAIGGANSQSPYIGIDSINESFDARLNQIFKIVLRRYYILSQGILPYHFHDLDERESGKSDQYIRLYAETEAVNLAESLVNANYVDNIKNAADTYVRNIPAFYDFANNITYTYEGSEINLFSFSDDSVEYFPINQSNTDEGRSYTNKFNSDFVGLSIYFGDVELQQTIGGGGTSNPIDKFKTDISGNWFERNFGFETAEALFGVSQENLQFIFDKPLSGAVLKGSLARTFNDGDTNYDGDEWLTRFLFQDEFYIVNDQILGAISKLEDVVEEYTPAQLLEGGNSIISDVTISGVDSDEQRLALGTSIVEMWINMLTEFDDAIFDTVINNNSNLSALVLLSNFGYTLSPFNKFPSDLNRTIFDFPSIVSVPKFLAPYIGALIDTFEGGVNRINEVVEFFTTGAGSNFKNKGVFIFADMHDVNTYLSAEDKAQFKREYEDFYFSQGAYTIDRGYNKILQNLNSLYTDVSDDVLNLNDKEESYRAFLDPLNGGNDGVYYKTVIRPLIERISIMNYSQITFRIKETYEETYTSISSLNNIPTSKTINDSFFQIFFQKLSQSILDKKIDNEEKQNEEKKVLGDPDIITQMYYSFKNINDKWLSSPTSANVGYPFSTGGNLIDSFVFVDRAMNPIGDTVINAEILAEMFDDPNITLYTALSQILSTNGFEFFPLQNFMNFKTGKWEDSFKIDTSGDIDSQIAFVCMYIGGSASYPATSNNDFKDDGITNIENPGVSDFSTQDCTGQNPNDDNQVQTYPNFPWRTVRAFRVKFGEQNQSMFTNLKIDSKEYPETNESIQILSRLAGDNKLNAPTPKGQNLYSLYENRSYKATVTSLGNAMIQPTQYFQLENVPMFNGAYVILDVEHSITPNSMMTTFSGTKILKYPIPRVTNPVVFVGLDDIGEDIEFNNVIIGSGRPEDLPDDFQISEYLTLYDTLAQGTAISGNGAARRGLTNIPNNVELENIKYLAKNIYDPLRNEIGSAIWIESFYRGAEYNAVVNGSENSQHRNGQAVDLDDDLGGYENSQLFYYIVNNLDFDQIIWEKGDGQNPGWVHVSLARGANRKKITLYYTSRIGKNVYESFKTLAEFETRKNEIYG